MNPPLPPSPPRPQSFAGQAAAALAIAIILPGLWSPFILLSFGLVTAAFVMAIVAITRGKPLAGALLIAACPLAAFTAFSMIGVRDEMQKIREERSFTNESVPDPPAAEWVRLTVDTQLSAADKQIHLVAGQRLKLLEKQGRYYAIEYEGGRYMIPAGITKDD